MAVTAQSAEFGTKFNSFCVKFCCSNLNIFFLFIMFDFIILNLDLNQANLNSTSILHRSIKMYFILMKTNQQGSICAMFTSALVKTKFPLKLYWRTLICSYFWVDHFNYYYFVKTFVMLSYFQLEQLRGTLKRTFKNSRKSGTTA